MLKEDQSFSASHLILSKLFYHIHKTKQNFFELLSTNKYTAMISYLVHCSSLIIKTCYFHGVLKIKLEQRTKYEIMTVYLFVDFLFVERINT